MKKRLWTALMLFVMVMVSIPCIGELTGGKFGTVEAEAATTYKKLKWYNDGSFKWYCFFYNKGKLVQLYEERCRGAHGVKVIGYNGGFVVHFSGIDYYDEIGFDEYIYYKKISVRKYQEVAVKTQLEDYDYGEWDYYAKSGSSWSYTKKAFDKQVKKVKTGTRKYDGSCFDWTYKSQ